LVKTLQNPATHATHPIRRQNFDFVKSLAYGKEEEKIAKSFYILLWLPLARQDNGL